MKNDSQKSASETKATSAPKGAHAAPAQGASPKPPSGPVAPVGSTAENKAAEPKTKMKKRNIAIAIVAAALALVAIGCGVASAFLNNVSKDLNVGTKTEQEIEDIKRVLPEKKPEPADPFYMLLIGSDKREGDPSMGQRSDTNIVARIDPANNTVILVSIPRDTKIQIEGYGTNKFNAAYAFKGTAGAIEAANELLGIEISHYAEVSFTELVGLVDAVGGVDIDVDTRINDTKADLDSDNNHVILEKGPQHLNGTQALSYARSRQFADGDFTRTSHQRQLVGAIVQKVLSLPITDLPGVIEKGAKCVTTDLTISELLDLAQQFEDPKNLEVYSAMVPSTTANIGGVSYVINDAEATKEMMALVEKGQNPGEIVSKLSTQEAIAQDPSTKKGSSSASGSSSSRPSASSGSSSSSSSGSYSSGGSSNSGGSSSGNGGATVSGGNSSDPGNGGSSGASGSGSGNSGSGSSGSGDSGATVPDPGSGSGSGTGDPGSGGSGGGSGTTEPDQGGGTGGSGTTDPDNTGGGSDNTGGNSGSGGDGGSSGDGGATGTGEEDKTAGAGGQ